MRILVLSNHYPPHHIGGYELGCHGVMTALQERGHDVSVLTSTYGVGEPVRQDGVYRWLEMPPKGVTLGVTAAIQDILRREANNQRAFERACEEFKPDIVYAWNMEHISISLLYLAQDRGLPTCCFVSDPWFERWESDLWYEQAHYQPNSPFGYARKAVIRALARAKGILWLSRRWKPNRLHFASDYLKRAAAGAGKQTADSQVIHWGIDINLFPYKETASDRKGLLYVGQVVPHKGVHTLIEALNLMVREPQYRDIQLTIAGGSVVPEYEKGVRDLVKKLHLERNVRFTGMLKKQDLIPLYQQNDILMFASIWEEPFAITPLEAMSAGLAVVGTGTGGSPEIFRHEENAMVFPKEDALTCARHTLRLLEDGVLFESLRRKGRRTIEQRFTFGDMVDKIEKSLEDVMRNVPVKSHTSNAVSQPTRYEEKTIHAGK